MRFNFDTFSVAVLVVSATPSFARPQPVVDIRLVSRDDAAALDARDIGVYAQVIDLWKRKGGGGGGGKGGGSGGSSSGGSSSGSSGSGSSSSGSSSSGSSSGSSGSGSSSSSSSAGKGTGKGSSSSNQGGSTKTGSGTTPAYGGGKYYGGGATTPYTSGGRSPAGISPIFLGAGVGAGVGAVAFLPGAWPYGAYAYPYYHPYIFHNSTAPSNSSKAVVTRQTTVDSDPGVNQTKPVTCFCAPYEECGCDDTGDTTFLDQLIGNGSYAALDKTIVNVADVNGTSTILLNGTLANGTTSSGGTENASAAGRTIAQASGYWVMMALVLCTVYFV